MELNLIALAIPVFFLMIAGEFAVARWMGRSELYRFNDAINDLSCGISHEVVGLFSKVLTFGLYTAIWANFAVFDFSEMPVLHWVLGLVLYDFFYYWWHRFTHEVNLGWATHVVHHQSQEYNLAVALRQSVTSWITGFPFYIPMAILGVSPLVWAISGAVSLLYQFWIHTEVIDKLGPLESVMNTPSHHRVHHAINPQYLDKNYAAILIVWDRMFGTFEWEVEQPVYGTVKPLNSFDPIWAQVWYFKLLIDDTRAARTTAERIKVWTSAPGYRPEGLPPYPAPEAVSRATQDKYDPQAPTGLMAYVAVQFVPIAIGLTALEMVEKSATTALLAVGGALVVWAVWSWGALHERRGVAIPSELARLVLTAALGAWWLDSVAAIAAVAGFSAVSALWLLSFNAWFSAPAPVEAAAK